MQTQNTMNLSSLNYQQRTREYTQSGRELIDSLDSSSTYLQQKKSEAAISLINQALSVYGINQTNVQEVWKFFKRHVTDLPVSLVKQIYLLSKDNGGPDWHEWVRFLQENYADRFVHRTLLQEALVTILIQANNADRPYALTLIQENNELRGVFNSMMEYDTAVKRFAVEQNAADSLIHPDGYLTCLPNQAMLINQAETMRSNITQGMEVCQRGKDAIYEDSKEGKQLGTPKSQLELCKQDKNRFTPIVEKWKAQINGDEAAWDNFLTFLELALLNQFPGALKEMADVVTTREIPLETMKHWKPYLRIYMKRAIEEINHPRAALFYRKLFFGAVDTHYDYLIAIQYLLGNAEQGFNKDIAKAKISIGYDKPIEFHLNNKEVDARSLWLIAEIAVQEGDIEKANQFLDTAAQLGQPLAIHEKQINEQLPLAEKDDVIAQQKVVESAETLTQLFARSELWLFPQPYQEKIERYNQLTMQFKALGIKQIAQSSENPPTESVEISSEEHYLNGMTCLSVGKTKDAIQAFNLAENYPKAQEQLKTLMKHGFIEISATNLNLVLDAFANDQESVITAALHEFLTPASWHANEKLGALNALKALADAILKRYGNNIPTQWQIYVKNAADSGHADAEYAYGKLLIAKSKKNSESGNFFSNLFETSPKTYFSRAAKQGHILAKKALVKVNDYTYAAELGLKCIDIPNELTPAKDAIKYLTLAADKKGDKVAMYTLVGIYENFSNEKYAKYFPEGIALTKEQADKVADIYREKLGIRDSSTVRSVYAGPNEIDKNL